MRRPFRKIIPNDPRFVVVRRAVRNLSNLVQPNFDLGNTWYAISGRFGPTIANSIGPSLAISGRIQPNMAKLPPGPQKVQTQFV